MADAVRAGRGDPQREGARTDTDTHRPRKTTSTPDERQSEMQT